MRNQVYKLLRTTQFPRYFGRWSDSPCPGVPKSEYLRRQKLFEDMRKRHQEPDFEALARQAKKLKDFHDRRHLEDWKKNRK